MTGELSSPFETVPQECFEQSITSSELAVQQVLGIEAAGYTVEFSEEESAISFPAVLKSVDKKMIVHLDSFDSFVEEYTERYPEIFYLDLAKVHIAATLVPSAIAQVLNPRDKTAITRLLDHMTSTDTLKEQVNEAGLQVGLDTFDILSLALLAKSDDDIGKINGLRLAIGALTYTENLTTSVCTPKREQVDFSERLVGAFRRGFWELPSELERYKATARILRQDQDVAGREFVKSISVLEIAAAFPMEVSELTMIASFINKSK